MHYKMKIVITISLLLVVGMAVVCVAPQTTFAESAVESVKISNTVSAKFQKILKSIEPPKNINSDAIPGEINISYPVFTSVKKADVAINKINEAISQRLLKVGATEGKSFTTVEKLTTRFAKGFENALIKDPKMIGSWSLRFEALIRYYDEELVCLDMMDSVFTGGAHPVSHIDYHVFSLKTGKPIALSALIPTKKLPELTKIAEKHFRVIRKLTPEQTYEGEGFYFANNKFVLNENFLVTKTGLVFFYNPYEIAPYAMGETQLEIPWKELKTLINPEGIGKRFL